MLLPFLLPLSEICSVGCLSRSWCWITTHSFQIFVIWRAFMWLSDVCHQCYNVNHNLHIRTGWRLWWLASFISGYWIMFSMLLLATCEFKRLGSLFDYAKYFYGTISLGFLSKSFYSWFVLVMGFGILVVRGHGVHCYYLSGTSIFVEVKAAATAFCSVCRWCMHGAPPCFTVLLFCCSL